MRQHCPCGLYGEVAQYDAPVWEPLLRVVGDRLVETFMWMHEERLDNGTVVHAYKHIYTRRYLYLSESGAAFERAPCLAYVPLRLDFALQAALCSWWLLDGWAAEDAAAVRDAVLRANRAGESHGPRVLHRRP